MSAVTANQVVRRQNGDRTAVPVAASTRLYEGTLAFITPAGYADDDTGSGANKFGGIVQADTDNSSGSAGALTAELLKSGVFELFGSGFAQEDVGKVAYATDNFTISTSQTASGVPIGVVDEYVSATALRIRIVVDDENDLIYSQVAASTAVTTTTSETAFDQAPTIKAKTLRAGNVIRVRVAVIATATNSTDTLTIKLYLGSTQICTTGAVDVANSDIAYIDVEITLRTVGASGMMVAQGTQCIGTPGTVTPKPFLLGSTAIDTTADLAVVAKATWSTNNAGNSCRQDAMSVQLLTR